MAVVEEIYQLVRNHKFEMAAKIAVDSWSRLTNLEPQERHAIITSTQPQEQSMVWIAILTAELDQRVIDWGTIIGYMSKFAQKFNVDQVRHLPNMFCQLFHLFTDTLCTSRKAIMGISIVREAIKRFAPNSRTLTAIHSDLIQLCLAARCVKPSLPFLEHDYTELYTDQGQFECQKVVQFFYYGGMVHTCLHDYLRALQCFTICLCVPAVSISAVMLAAYKKYILVSLLRYGRLVSLPRCSSDMVERILKGPSRPYVELAKSYSARDQAGIKKTIAGFMDNFVSDGNYGLVQRVETQMAHHAVQRLTMSFLKLPLQDAAQRIELKGSEEMEKMLRDMIEGGEVNATLSQMEGRVEFLDCSVDSCTDTVKMLEKRLKQCMELQEQLAQANRQLSMDTRYIQKSGSSSLSLSPSLGLSLGLEDDPLHEEHLL